MNNLSTLAADTNYTFTKLTPDTDYTFVVMPGLEKEQVLWNGDVSQQVLTTGKPRVLVSAACRSFKSGIEGQSPFGVYKEQLLPSARIVQW